MAQYAPYSAAIAVPMAAPTMLYGGGNTEFPGLELPTDVSFAEADSGMTSEEELAMSTEATAVVAMKLSVVTPVTIESNTPAAMPDCEGCAFLA